MARPRSEEKREAILAAATELVAALGTGAPTAKIARAAGVSEGALFTYFETKDELLNQLFLSIESDLARAVLASDPADGGARERTQEIWSRAIEWGVANPLRRKAWRQLKVSDRISAESRRCSDGLFREALDVIRQSLAGRVDPDRESFYIDAVLYGLIETTIEAIAGSPKDHERLKAAGFDLFWKGVAA